MDDPREVLIDYTNHRGERAERWVIPTRLFFGATEWHPCEQWLLDADDIAKGEARTFALAFIHSWRPVSDPRDAEISRLRAERAAPGHTVRHLGPPGVR